jgi:hypothetical protein
MEKVSQIYTPILFLFFCKINQFFPANAVKCFSCENELCESFKQVECEAEEVCIKYSINITDLSFYREYKRCGGSEFCKLFLEAPIEGNNERKCNWCNTNLCNSATFPQVSLLLLSVVVTILLIKN